MKLWGLRLRPELDARHLGLQKTGNQDVVFGMNEQHQGPCFGAFIDQVLAFRKFVLAWPADLQKDLQKSCMCIISCWSTSNIHGSMLKDPLLRFSAICGSMVGNMSSLIIGANRDTMDCLPGRSISLMPGTASIVS